MNTSLQEHGFLRVGTATPQLKVADVEFNVNEMITQTLKAQEQGVQILTFPELSLTGYTCGDLFEQELLLKKSQEGLKTFLEATKGEIITIIGMPLQLDNQLFNVGVVSQNGKVLGVVPKTHLPGYGEFYEERRFASANDALSTEVQLGDDTVPFGTNVIFSDPKDPKLAFGVEICEDAWVPNAPSIDHSLAGSLVTFNLSASNEIVGKEEYRKNLVNMRSGTNISGYVYASSGVGESSTDLVFGGSALIAENGSLLAEGERFSLENQLLVSDINVQKLMHDRRKTTSFMSGAQKKLTTPFRKIPVNLENTNTDLQRSYPQMPFVPSDEAERAGVCEEILNIQASGLAKRLQHIGTKTTVIGISGGLDSTLAFLVIMKAYEKL
jgi:NAD+ synthase (glutamine-hydrolysing)